MDVIEYIKNKLEINESKKLSMWSLIITVLAGMAAHHQLIIHGFTNPDGICEGLTYYFGADWALGGCGRWAIRYMNEITCNIVMPLYVVFMYCVCIWLAIVLLSKLWKISDVSVILLSVIMITTPTVVEQLGYTYTALAYSFSCFFSVLFVYAVFRKNWKIGLIVGTGSVTVMLGLYQSYVGMVAALVFMTIIVDLINLKDVKQMLINCVVCIVSSLLGCFLYSKILENELAKYALDNSGTRVAEFNFETIIESFGESFNYVYLKFYYFVTDVFMHRDLLIKGTIGIIILVLLWEMYCLIRKKTGIIRAILVIVLFLLLPAAINIIGILIPYNGVGSLMQYQNVLIIPFMLTCVDGLKAKKGYKIVQGVAAVMVVTLTWTYLLAANATYKCYELSYKHINSQMQIAIGRVYDLDDYVMNETPILIAGFPSDTVLKNNMDIYQYAENLCENPAFWVGMHGATKNRYLYFLNYFGIDAKQFSDDDYERIIDTAEFEDMSIWPDKGSVKMIDGFAVVKFTDEPPMP